MSLDFVEGDAILADEQGRWITLGHIADIKVVEGEKGAPLTYGMLLNQGGLAGLTRPMYDDDRVLSQDLGEYRAL